MAQHVKKCPTCGRPTGPKRKEHPFCSERCRLIDLGNWASESYVVHSPLTEADEKLVQEMQERRPPQDDPTG